MSTKADAAAEFDCVNLMRRGSSNSTTPSACERLNLLSDVSSRSEFHSFGFSPSSTPIASSMPLGGGKKCFGASLSSDAPDFVPRQANADDDDTPEKVALHAKPSTQRRKILGDITNLSPMKVTLPTMAIKPGGLVASFGEGVFSERRPSILDIYEDDLEQVAAGSASGSENGKDRDPRKPIANTEFRPPESFLFASPGRLGASSSPTSLAFYPIACFGLEAQC